VADGLPEAIKQASRAPNLSSSQKLRRVDRVQIACAGVVIMEADYPLWQMATGGGDGDWDAAADAQFITTMGHVRQTIERYDRFFMNEFECSYKLVW